MTIQWENYIRPRNAKAWVPGSIAGLLGVKTAGEMLFGTTFGVVTSFLGLVATIGLMGYVNQSEHLLTRKPKPVVAAGK